MMESGTQKLRKKSEEIQNKQVSDRIIASAIAVHRELGPGFLESAYEGALAVEFDLTGIRYERQKPLPLVYRGRPIGEHRLDFLVEGLFVVELKAVSGLEPIYFSVVRSYLKAASLNDALLFNFATMPLTIKRVGRERPSDLASAVDLHHSHS